MDRELIEGLSNLSASLDKISEALSKREEPKSATAAALKMGQFEKQIKEISMSIIEVKKDTQRILDQQDTIIKILKKQSTQTVRSEEKKTKPTTQTTVVEVSKQKKEERESKPVEKSRPVSQKPTTQTTVVEVSKQKKEERESKPVEKSRPVSQKPTVVEVSKQKKEEREFREKKEERESSSFFSKMRSSFSSVFDIFKQKKEEKREKSEDKKVKTVSEKPTTVEVSKQKKEERSEPEDKKVKTVSEKPTTVEVSKQKREEKREKIEDKKVKRVSDGKPATEEVAKEKREERKEEKKKSGLFGNIDSKKIKDGVATILLIAVGIVAIGLALKVVGKVDFVSVMALALALPLIAFAFQKVAATNIDAKKIPAMILGLVGFSTAIMISSFILSKVRPIGVAQAVTAILIGGVFSALSFGLHKIIRAFSKMSLLGGVKAVLFMPLVLLAISTAIALSSYALAMVKPIGIFQAMSAIMIAGVFSVLAFGLGKLIRGFRGIDPVTAYAAAKMMPIVLIGVIALFPIASYLLSAIKPIGFFQALTAILIAGVFTVLSFGIGKIISSFRRVNPAAALAAATIMPLIFIALSFSIMMSSYFLSNVKVIGIFQALTAIAISIVFVALSFGIAKILPAFRRLSPADVAKATIAMPVIFTALSFAIMISSYFISAVKPIGFAQFLTALGISILFVAFAFATKIVVKGLRGVTTAQTISAMKTLLIVATTVAIASFIVAVTPEIPLKKVIQFGLLGVGLGLTAIAMAIAIKTIKKIGVSVKDVLTGGLIILGIATTIAISSIILNIGRYEKYPSWKWAVGVGLTLVAFGLAAVVLGSIAMSGVGALAILAGLASILAIAGTIVLVDKIISVGKYDKYPGLKWGLGVGASMVGFGLAALVLGTAIVATGGLGALAIGAGLVSILAIAGTVVLVDKIISSGTYSKYPGLKWGLGVGASMTGFGLAALTLGTIIVASGGLGAIAIGAGLIAVLGIAKAVVKVDKIIATGSYTKYPGVRWILGVGASMLGFGLAALALGTAIVATVGIGAIAIKSGLWAIEGIAKTVVKTDKILSTGNYNKYPGAGWILGVGASMVGFGLAAITLGSVIVGTLGLGGLAIKAGLSAVESIAKSIVQTDKILSVGSYTKFPDAKWAFTVGGIITAFSTAVLLLGAVSSGGGLMQKLSLGLVKNPINSGIDAIKQIAKAIVDVDKILAQGSYTKGPNPEWAKGISSTLSAFTPIYKMLLTEKLMSFFGGGVSANDFSKAIKVITGGIVDSAKTFEKAQVAFKKGPPVEWSKGVSTSLAAFQPIYEILLKNTGWWKSGVDPKMFAQAIITITNGIVTAARSFGAASVAFKNGPPVAWSEGVSKSLAAFQPIYELLLKNTGWWKSGIDPKMFSQAIVTITGGVVSAAKAFGSAAVAFKNGPPVQWSEGVSKSLSAFQPIYEILLKNSGWWKSGVDPKMFAQAIVTITGGVVTAAKAFGKEAVAFKNGPPVQWAEGVSKSLSAFQPIYELLLKNTGWWKSGVDPKMFAQAIVTITGGIVTAAKSFGNAAVAFKNGPPVQWALGVSTALAAFQPIYELLVRNSSWWKKSIEPKVFADAIVTITSGIVTAGKNFGKEAVAFKNGPPVQWALGVSTALAAFQPIYEILVRNSSWWKKSIEPKTFADAIVTITSGVILAAKNFSKESVSFKNGPPIEWAKGVSTSLSAFQPIYELLVKNSSWWRKSIQPKQFAEAIIVITSGIITAAKNFGKEAVAFRNGPPVQWALGVSTALGAFQPIYELLVRNSSWWKSSIDPKKFSEAIITITSGIVTAARSFGSASVAFKNGPPVQWAVGVGAALAAFQPIYGILIKNASWWSKGVDPKTYAQAIRTMSQGIVDSALILSRGTIAYKSFPTIEWANGVSRALSVFQPIYKILQKDSGWFRSNISPEKYATAIKTITSGIRDSAMVLATAKAAYGIFPTVSWADGVSRALSVFQPIYKILQKDSGWFRSNISPEKYANAIKTITTGIRDAAIILSKGALAYKSYPTTQWADGVSRALSAFHPIYKILQKDSGWFRSNISPEKYAAAIRTISQGIVDSALVLSKASAAYKIYPTKDWAEGVSKALTAFSPIYTVLKKESSWFSSGPSVEKFGSAIKMMSQSIVDASQILNKGQYKIFPNMNWVLGITGAFSLIPNLIKIVSKVNFKELAKVWMISDSIVKLSQAFTSAKFTSFPNKKWSDGIGSAFKIMVGMMKMIDKSISIASLAVGYLKIQTISKLILDLDKKLSMGKYQKYPSNKWSQESSKSILHFGNLLMTTNKLLSIIDMKLGEFKVKGLLKTILLIDEQIGKGRFTKMISQKWSDGVRKTITDFSNLLTFVNKNTSIVDLKLGQFKIKNIMSSILDVESQILKGKFTKVISQQWSSGVRKTITDFANLLNFVNKTTSLIDLKLGQHKIKSIMTSILDVERHILKGKFTKLISQKWSDGVKKTITDFSNLILSINKNVSLIALKSGQLKVKSIITSILDIEKIINKGKFTKIISEQWSKSIRKTITDFSNLILSINKNVPLIGLKMGEIKIKSIIKSILEIERQIFKGKFNRIVDEKWTKNLTNTINQFGRLHISVNKEFSIPALLAGFTKIRLITQNILWIEKTLSRKFDKSPNDKWLSQTKNAITSLGRLATDAHKMFPITTLLMGIKKIQMISDTILHLDKKFGLGKYQKLPSDAWIKKSKNSILTFGHLSIDSNKLFSIVPLLAGVKKIKIIADTLLFVDKTLSMGKYVKTPSQTWLSKTKSSILQFGGLAIESDKRFGLIKLKLGLKKVRDISDTIRYVSLSLEKGKYDKFPSLEWSKSVPMAITQFMNMPFKGVFSTVFDKLFGSSEKDKVSQIGKVIDLMLYVDKRFQSGNWKKFPTVSWVTGTIMALQKFQDIVKLLSFSSLSSKLSSAFGGKNPLVTAVSNIEKLAISFDKLGSSLKSFSQSIKTLDTEKLAAIRSLSSNVILMSLMNPEQFDQMLAKLEERSGVFADLMKDLEKKKAVSGDSGVPGQKTAGVGMTNFKPASQSKTLGGKTQDTRLLEKLDTMTALLSDISSVVGSRGALKNYLSSLKEDVDIGDSGFSLFNRSDKRSKNILRKIGVSESGVNIYLFTYKFDPTVVYQGVIAQELLNTEFEKAVRLDKSGYYSVDYSKLDVEFKRTN
jgi:hypothetical protein